MDQEGLTCGQQMHGKINLQRQELDGEVAASKRSQPIEMQDQNDEAV